LLLSEEPGYGYRLVKDLQEFHFGRVDRPSVYRALAQLESDGLVESWTEGSRTGSARHVYALTEPGERILRAWMGVIRDERDCLDRVLARYQATGTADALIAEAGGLGALHGRLSAVSSTASFTVPPRRVADAGSRHGSGVLGPGSARTSPANVGPDGHAPLDAAPTTRPDAARVGEAWADESAAAGQAEPPLRRYRLLEDRSVILVDVRSSVGPISFGALGVRGWVDAAVPDGAVRLARAGVAAQVRLAVEDLRCGNSLYDAELLRRIDARQYPWVTVELRGCTPLGPTNRCRVAGDVTFHGVTRSAEGTVSAEVGPDGRLVVDGEQAFDIRDFDLDSPTVLMLRIYPDVRVRLHVEAVPGSAGLAGRAEGDEPASVSGRDGRR
jgi:DNA-binding PadR family transcriptional regulator